MEMLNSGELLIRQKREAVNRTFEKLLDFSFSDDFLLLRDRDKFNEYRMKREMATTTLNELKRYYPSDIQHAQIDTISSLLQEKEALLLGVMNTLSDLLRSDSLFQRRIPAVALQMHIPLLPGKSEKEKKKRSGFLGLFKKKEENRPMHTKGKNETAVRIPANNQGTLFPTKRNVYTIYRLLE